MTVYLLHFASPIGDKNNPRGQAQHYIGSTDDLDSRLARHADGNGAAIMAYLSSQQIGFALARTWEGGRTEERKLKNNKKASRLCPICQGKMEYQPYSERNNDHET